MKKLIIFFSILFLVDTVYGQALKTIKLDSLVTISLPAVYGKKDTLGQQIYSATTSMGYMIAILEPNAKTNQPLQKEGDLNSVLKKYIKGIQSQSGDGSAQSIRDTTIGGRLKAKAFTLVTKDPNGDPQYRRFLLLYTKEATYTFQYGYGEARKDFVKDEAKSFFGSIKLSPELTLTDQYTNTAKSHGVSSTLLIEIAGGVAVLFGVLWLIFRRKRVNELT